MLVSRIHDEIESDLVHDGLLSASGACLVERAGILGESTTEPETMSDEKASVLASELLDFASDHPEVEKWY